MTTPVLRELRLWHWEQMMQQRALALRAAADSMNKAHNAMADRHLRFVQELNDQFPDFNDTAERDMERAGHHIALNGEVRRNPTCP